MGASSTDARQSNSKSTSRGSTVYSGSGDAMVAREGDLSVIGSTVEGINTTLAAAQKLILSSGQNTRENRETNVGGSTEVGVTIGSEDYRDLRQCHGLPSASAEALVTATANRPECSRMSRRNHKAA